MDFHKIWIEQCEATRGIEDEFGTDKALKYLVEEKFIDFLEAAETNAEFRAEIPAFVAEIKTIFEPQPIGDYPPRRSEGDVPLPNVSFQGDPDWNKDGWNKEMVGGILCNPVLAGVPPFKAAVDEQAWIAAGVRMVGEVGLRQYLVNVLYQLKKSVNGVSLED
jgi:hypothetical protein